MIKINKLKKSFPSGFTLNIDGLHIEKGERVALIGTNGSGKTTLLRILSGIIKPDSGTFEVSADKADIAYEPQSPYVFKGTVEKNILLGAKDKNADEIIKQCSLTELKDKSSSLLSGGEKQRMCFARMLARPHSLLLLDEPLSATDILTAERLEKLLVEKCEENNTTLLFSTHLPSQALAVATKILIMNNGEIAEYSDISALSSPKSEFGKLFISQWKTQVD